MQGEMELDEGNYLVKLKGNPWTSEEAEGMDARRFLLDTIRRFQDLGYFPYNTANLKGTADSIFFVRHPDGLPAHLAMVFPTSYCMISLNQHDRLRLVDCPEELRPVIREAPFPYFLFPPPVPNSRSPHSGHTQVSRGEEHSERADHLSLLRIQTAGFASSDGLDGHGIRR